LSLTVPLAAAPEPSNAAVRLAYRDLAVSEEVWSLIDPSGAVPRNPLTVVLDATAQVQLMVDLMSAEAMAMDRPPGELRALSVSELEVTFGGTSLTGTANMTFAPGQIVPQPVGAPTCRLSVATRCSISCRARGSSTPNRRAWPVAWRACSPGPARCPTRSKRRSSSSRAAALRRTACRLQ
jgi:hypothetical protein